jgi:2-phospho-L-lactate/phosphoenolpyruvate guanylyltransferase
VSCWALVPLKERAACKTRLTAMLSSQGRLQLVRALLRHVIGTLQITPGIDHIALVSPERDDVAGDIALLARERQGLNEDLTYALNEATQRGATCAVIVPADLPLVEPADVSALLESIRYAGVVLAPDRHERGTNALALATPSPLALSFGEDSFEQHLAQTRSLGIEPTVLRRSGFSFDVDDVEDLQRLRAYPRWAELIGNT